VNLFGIIEGLAADPEHTGVRLEQDRCLHGRARLAECTACLELCPARAIDAGRPPSLDRAVCVRCRACLPACPAGAYQAADALTPLLQVAAQQPGTTLELICSFHPAPETGAAEIDTAVRVEGCLAGLGNGVLVALAALGLRQVVLRTEACGGCPLGELHSVIGRQVEQARHLLVAWELAGVVRCGDAASDQEPVQRRLRRSGSVTYSRRRLFRLGAEAESELPLPSWLAAALTGEQSSPPSANHRLLLAALDHLNRRWPQAPPSLAGLGLGSLTMADDQCTACGTCARICPTAALAFEEKDSRFRLTLAGRHCIACGLCVQVCTPRAMELNTSPSYYQLFNELGPLVLAAGALSRCHRCNGFFAARPDQHLCGICALRHESPVTSRLPPGRRDV
jgi:energy-converting hydrogenase A subunit P